jgi:hypothetical protein
MDAIVDVDDDVPAVDARSGAVDTPASARHKWKHKNSAEDPKEAPKGTKQSRKSPVTAMSDLSSSMEAMKENRLIKNTRKMKQDEHKISLKMKKEEEKTKRKLAAIDLKAKQLEFEQKKWEAEQKTEMQKWKKSKNTEDDE